MNDTKATKGTTKSATVRRLLVRDGGATLEEMIVATGWKPHSCRAFLTGVRKSGDAVIKLERTDGRTAWRVANQAEAEA
ncbi:MAG: DUF3489 domain-containing protein [Erythrobacter sp.]|nr:DUF3489 domain-containing protein [Erythrobacter sp.]MDZ4273295.1 DUF3489 domain-containing protein [Erythrobacter sp.]